MRNYFYKLSDHAMTLIGGSDFLYLNLSGEESDFVRLNHAKIRQNGHVSQYYCLVTLVSNKRQASGYITLTRDPDNDKKLVENTISNIKKTIAQIDEDPYILYSTNVRSTEIIEKNMLPHSRQTISEIIKSANGLDLVGIFSSGEIVTGFTNSIGQKNWFEKPSFNFNWSVYHTTDKAVKAGYAGYIWDSQKFLKKMEKVKTELEIMKREAVTIKPGKYRVYLAPAALDDFMATLGWGGFGMKSQKTKNSPLVKLVENEVSLNPLITLTENSLDGSSPNFNSMGFIKPDKVVLIEKGKHKGSLISPRSSKEFGVEQNGANSFEEPVSLEMSEGNISSQHILKELVTGIYLNNVHYLNYSERTSCKMTGMSRFAAMYVKNGEITAPINVMRFDESIFKMLGENFAGATKERERLMSTSTYGERATDSTLLPGIIVNDFSFTL